MSNTNLIRLGGFAAAIAGILRGVNSFLPSALSDEAIALLYLLTDIFLLFGMMGLYGFQHQRSGLWGFFGFLLTIIGIAIIRTGTLSTANLYPVGASIFAAGISSFAVGSWIAGNFPKWISAFWIISTVVGFIGYFIPNLNLLFAIAGLLFGVGFASAGLKVFLAKPLSPDARLPKR
ncbi:MAG: hypothetical protein WA885_15295 [Phormidesmis sp.]